MSGMAAACSLAVVALCIAGWKVLWSQVLNLGDGNVAAPILLIIFRLPCAPQVLGRIDFVGVQPWSFRHNAAPNSTSVSQVQRMLNT